MHLLEVPSGLHVRVPSGVTRWPCGLWLQHCDDGTAISFAQSPGPTLFGFAVWIHLPWTEVLSLESSCSLRCYPTWSLGEKFLFVISSFDEAAWPVLLRKEERTERGGGITQHKLHFTYSLGSEGHLMKYYDRRETFDNTFDLKPKHYF